MSERRLPDSLIAEVAGTLANFHTRATLEHAFLRAGAPGPPPFASSKLKLATEWLYQVDADPALDAHTILGNLLQGWMEAAPPPEVYQHEDIQKEWREYRERMQHILGKHGLAYRPGGKLFGATLSAPSRSLADTIRYRDLPAIEVEFERATANISADPPAAVTAACAILEATCKAYIAARGLPLPADQSISPVWRVVQGDLDLDPARVHDQGVKRVLGGLASIVDGVAGLRTRTGSAHGHGPDAAGMDQPTARLAVHAAHSLVRFLLDHPRWPTGGVR